MGSGSPSLLGETIRETSSPTASVALCSEELGDDASPWAAHALMPLTESGLVGGGCEVESRIGKIENLRFRRFSQELYLRVVYFSSISVLAISCTRARRCQLRGVPRKSQGPPTRGALDTGPLRCQSVAMEQRQDEKIHEAPEERNGLADHPPTMATCCWCGTHCDRLALDMGLCPPCQLREAAIGADRAGWDARESIDEIECTYHGTPAEVAQQADADAHPWSEPGAVPTEPGEYWLWRNLPNDRLKSVELLSVGVWIFSDRLAPWEPEQMTAAAVRRGWRFRPRWAPSPPQGDA